MPSAPQAFPNAMSKRRMPDLSSRLNATRCPPASSTATDSGRNLRSRPVLSAASTMVEACASVSGSMGLLELIWRHPYRAAELSCLATLRPVGGDRRAIPRAPAAAASLFEALGGALGQGQLEAAGATFGRHGAQVLSAGIDGEGRAAAARALELGSDHGGARLDGVGGSRDVGEDAQKPLRVDAEVAGERECLPERLP